jgi:hypothetical protein
LWWFWPSIFYWIFVLYSLWKWKIQEHLCHDNMINQAYAWKWNLEHGAYNWNLWCEKNNSPITCKVWFVIKVSLDE